ncbi:MAG: hypothetical protein ACLVKO_08170 [Dysgonomonas sp.]
MQDLSDKGLIDDAKTNKEALHPLGSDIPEYSKKYNTGNRNQDATFPIGYEKKYNNKSTTTSDILFFIGAFSQEGAEMRVGYIRGKDYGEKDREAGKINILSPYSSLKNNEPLIKLKK